MDTIFKVKVHWPWRYRSRSKVITCDKPSHASDHLYQIWKESIQNCRRYRADTIFKVKAEWPWNIGRGQRSLYATHPLIIVIICAKYGKNTSRTVDLFFKVKAEKFQKFAKNSNFQILKTTLHATHPLMIVIICAKYKKNPSRTVDATERTRFSKSRLNDLEDIGQGQRSLCATHPLIVVINCG